MIWEVLIKGFLLIVFVEIVWSFFTDVVRDGKSPRHWDKPWEYDEDGNKK